MTESLVEGLRRFRREAFPRLQTRYKALVEGGQSPHTLFIGCSDSRLVPDLLTNTGPGELFMIRNMGNLIPPYDPREGYHGTVATVEFAVLTLGVRHIVVCGHSHCGAVRALYSDPNPDTPHTTQWLELARPARVGDEASEDNLRRAERRSVVIQLERLLGYPMVRDRAEAGTLALHGWYYVIEEGVVEALDIDTGRFEAVT